MGTNRISRGKFVKSIQPELDASIDKYIQMQKILMPIITKGLDHNQINEYNKIVTKIKDNISNEFLKLYTQETKVHVTNGDVSGSFKSSELLKSLSELGWKYSHISETDLCGKDE